MEPPDSDQGRALTDVTLAADQTREAFAGTAGALHVLEQTWDRALREFLHRLNALQQGDAEALRLTRLFVDRRSTLA